MTCRLFGDLCVSVSMPDWQSGDLDVSWTHAMCLRVFIDLSAVRCLVRCLGVKTLCVCVCVRACVRACMSAYERARARTCCVNVRVSLSVWVCLRSLSELRTTGT